MVFVSAARLSSISTNTALVRRSSEPSLGKTQWPRRRLTLKHLKETSIETDISGLGELADDRS